MANKLSLLVLCGGVSTEHDISLDSASSVVAALDSEKYNVAIVYISRQGEWYYCHDADTLLSQDIKKLMHSDKAVEVTWRFGENRQLIAVNNPQQRFSIDCVFPVLHGTNGEDGSMQGLLQLLNLPYVGTDVLSSAICMDKDITKQLLKADDIQVVPWQLLDAQTSQQQLFQRLNATLGQQLVVKPASLGSSVGVALVDNEADFLTALNDALRYDHKVLVESFVSGREIECAVMGNQEQVIVAPPGEVVLQKNQYQFYSYAAKYLDKEAVKTVAVADLTAVQIETLKDLATRVFKQLCCSGMLRVDFFVSQAGDIYVNEVNTIPGFTDISLYPKMWQASGVSYQETLNRLIDSALQKQRCRETLQRTYAVS